MQEENNDTKNGVKTRINGEVHYLSLADLQPFHWSKVYQ